MWLGGRWYCACRNTLSKRISFEKQRHRIWFVKRCTRNGKTRPRVDSTVTTGRRASARDARSKWVVEALQIRETGAAGWRTCAQNWIEPRRRVQGAALQTRLSAPMGGTGQHRPARLAHSSTERVSFCRRGIAGDRLTKKDTSFSQDSYWQRFAKCPRNRPAKPLNKHPAHVARPKREGGAYKHDAHGLGCRPGWLCGRDARTGGAALFLTTATLGQ